MNARPLSTLIVSCCICAIIGVLITLWALWLFTNNLSPGRAAIAPLIGALTGAIICLPLDLMFPASERPLPPRN